MTSNSKGHTTFMLQNYSPNNTNGDSYDQIFVLDTCAHLDDYTKVEGCMTEEQSQGVLENMYVDFKVQTNFWNSKNFLRNGKEMNSQFVGGSVQLNSAVFQRQAYTL